MRSLLSNLIEKRLSKEGDKLCHVKEKALRKADEREVSKMNNDELMHYGVIGQKWGIRRYQNKDGTLTSAGRKQYRKQLKTDSKTRRAIKKNNA